MILPSNHRAKKYRVRVRNKTIHWGEAGQQHYRDVTPLRLYTRLDHENAARRKAFWKATTGKTTKRDAMLEARRSGNTELYYTIRYLY